MELFFSGRGDNWLGGLMTVALFLVGASTTAALWLRGLQRGWNNEAHA